MDCYNTFSISCLFLFFFSLEPYTPTGNFEVDFCELCSRAGFPTMQVVPRPHRPPTPNVIPQDNTPVGKLDKKDGKPYLTVCWEGMIGQTQFVLTLCTLT